MCEEEREELWLEGGGVRYVYTDDYVDSIRAKVAELQSSYDALEAKLAKYQNLEAVGYFEQEYVGGPVLFYQVNYKAEGSIPLYALEK